MRALREIMRVGPQCRLDEGSHRARPPSLDVLWDHFIYVV